jgi:hypothetical protein
LRVGGDFPPQNYDGFFLTGQKIQFTIILFPNLDGQRSFARQGQWVKRVTFLPAEGKAD